MKTIPILLLLAFVSGCAQTLAGIGASWGRLRKREKLYAKLGRSGT